MLFSRRAALSCRNFVISDCAHGWVIPIRGEGGGEAVDPTQGVIDLVDLLHTIPRK